MILQMIAKFLPFKYILYPLTSILTFATADTFERYVSEFSLSII